MKDFMEKIKANKKMVAIAGILILAIIIVAIIASQAGGSYKKTIKNFAKAMEKSISETTLPYLENILYSLNKLNESFNKGSGGDVVDKLF